MTHAGAVPRGVQRSRCVVSAAAVPAGEGGVPGLSTARGGAGCGCLTPPPHWVRGDDGLAGEVSRARRAVCCLAHGSTEQVPLLGMSPVVVCPADPRVSRR